MPLWDEAFEAAMSRPKDFELGQNDLHLEVPGQYDPTMYPDIYGIPENFLLLLSHVTRLANEKDILQYSASKGNLTYPHLASRAKTLERCVLRWQPDVLDYRFVNDETTNMSLLEANKRVIKHYLLALQQALIIYFYRRIRDLDPIMLKGNVLSTVTHLEACQREDSQNCTLTVTSVWPAFIGACEVLDQDTQSRYVRWLDDCFERSHVATFKRARTIADEVWAKRKESMNQDADWLQLSRNQQIGSIIF